MSKPRVIAFYLPQYHPTPHNDEWWGKGFTEWTNVARAKPLFRGHEQPHIPGELGFYDLRLPQVREAQAELAKAYGIYGFCYYYYRFERDKNELELPLNEVLKSGKPDFPFMICWANESWHKKFWKYDGTCEKQILAEQKYGNKQDYRDFFYEVLPLFQDNRYIKIDGKPAFMIYKPKDFANVSEFIKVWNNLANENGLEGIHFIGFSVADSIPTYSGQSITLKEKVKILSQKSSIEYDKNIFLNAGFNSMTLNRQNIYMQNVGFVKKIVNKLYKTIMHRPYIIRYKDIVKTLYGEEDFQQNIYPVVIPNWDHTPRSHYGGILWHNSTPNLYYEYLKKIVSIVKTKDIEHQIIFLKAWNEWGEGNYLEPDLKYGRQYLEATKKALESF